MAQFNYARAQRTAEGLLAKFGPVEPVALFTLGDGREGFDPGPATPIEYQTRCVIMPFSKAADNRTEFDSLLEEDLRIIILSPLQQRISPTGPDSFEPRSSDWVVSGSDRWVLLSSTPLSPAGIPVYHKAEARRG